MLQSVLVGLDPHRELVGQIAGLLTVLQYLAGCFTCAEIHRRRSSEGVSPVRFIGGCSLSVLQLQYFRKLQSSSLVATSTCTLSFSVLYTLWFLWYTPAASRGPFYRKALGTTAVTAALCAYGSQAKDPVTLHRLGLIITVLALIFIALPLAQLRKVIRAKSTAALPLPAILASTGASVLWLVYGLLIRNSFIVLQKTIALALCAAQLCLFIIYPATGPSKGEKKQ
ncbi:sugar transporter SWEET1-like isoform X1 [Anopheles cruzii]|uniref:sugar transporter SWEET1-like isoform X1 n=1 Tax=Anopheles cruzii TaxID=68878 RepID=UPI0022EC3552|nr:sugar transporter SWEET1-like isoform X1 [Anopheles cruzii]